MYLLFCNNIIVLLFLLDFVWISMLLLTKVDFLWKSLLLLTSMPHSSSDNIFACHLGEEVSDRNSRF